PVSSRTYPWRWRGRSGAARDRRLRASDGRLDRPGLQPEGGIPEHPLELRGAGESRMHARAQERSDLFSGVIGGRDHGAYRGVEFLARISIDPSSIWSCRRRAGVDVAPDLGVDPEAGQQRCEQNFIRLGIGRGEKITNVVVTCRRERRLRKELRRDAVLLEKRPVQRALDDEGALRGF